MFLGSYLGSGGSGMSRNVFLSYFLPVVHAAGAFFSEEKLHLVPMSPQEPALPLESQSPLEARKTQRQLGLLEAQHREQRQSAPPSMQY